MAHSRGFIAVSLFVFAIAAAPLAFADDSRPDYDIPGYGWHMGPGYGQMGPGYGRMGPGYGQMGPGYGHMGPGYGHMGPGYGRMMGLGGPMGGYWFHDGRVDANDNGIISDAEAARHFERRFFFLDADGDGALTQDEYLRFRPPFWAGWRKDIEKRYVDRFKSMDSDKDGKVDKGEYMAFHREQFAAADTNKDGKVDVWEYRSQRRR